MMTLDIRTEKTDSPKPRPADHELSFGKFFTDHVLMSHWAEGSGWGSSCIQPYAKLALDPAASTLHYGQAMFEGLKAFRHADGKVYLFRVDAHARRMHWGASRLCMPALEPEDFVQAMKSYVAAELDWVPKASGTALYLRPTLIADEAFLGVRPSRSYLFFTIASPVGSYYGGDGLKPVKIWVEREFVRAAPGGLGAVKAAANYASSLKAAVAAKKNGFDQVLWLDAKEHEYVEEVGTMNLFAVIGGKLVTPPLSDSILAGITRDSILHMADDLGIQSEERRISLSEIKKANADGSLTEVFGSGTAAVISPVGELAFGDERLIIANGKPGPIAERLNDEITGIQRGTKADRYNWLTQVA